jgi:hypothetical protein
MEEMYKKVFIKTEADLPKEEGEYTCRTKLGTLVDIPYSFTGGVFTKAWWLMYIKYYYQPYPPQLQEVTDEMVMDESYKRYPCDYGGIPNSHEYSFCAGAEWMREQMKGGTK